MLENRIGNRVNGNHDVAGRFTRGNKAARGSNHSNGAGELRAAILACTTPEDVQAVIRTLHALAVGGDVRAARVYFEHTAGKPLQSVEIAYSESEGLPSRRFKR